ncbi:TPA: ead/Ea22-like family protein, partial [Citrobacter amalonaticus]|nr:ead/Ea22-like family protein [Citrobacter amalonaticus]HCC6293998.1 ead/Ea22-like family protein [Citrobacter amalonaticus]HCC6430694.1 ead/Ea22-like family protein [Citrobacter amalonaticus]HCC7016901.1 ead/Ea22-like family protein [Citrobacter amalonaticus]
MSNIDKRALREAAEKALNARARLALMQSVFDDDGDDVKPEAQDDISICISFNELTNPATVLALLDEMEAKDKQIAELVAGRQNLQRMMGVYVHAYEEAKEQIAKDVEIKARLCIESNSLFDRLRAAEKRIADYHRALNNLAAVARRYLPDYDEHPDIQAADDLLESA